MATLIVTGAAGALGSELCRQLAWHGHRVIGIDRRPARVPTSVFLTADLSVSWPRDVAAFCADAVVHTASLHGAHAATVTPQHLLRHNVRCTAQALRMCQAVGAPRFVYTSSTSVYGASAGGASEAASGAAPRRAVVYDETSPLRPQDAYDRSKVAGEAMVAGWAAGPHRRAVVLRTSRFSCDDPREHALRLLNRGVDVRDAAAAHVLAATVWLPEPLECFNVSAASPLLAHDPDELFAHARPLLQAQFPDAEAAFAGSGHALPGSIDRIYGIERATRRLGYRPRHSFHSFLDEAACPV